MYLSYKFNSDDKKDKPEMEEYFPHPELLPVETLQEIIRHDAELENRRPINSKKRNPPKKDYSIN